MTQNIDNLHQSSGISPEHVIELHGNNTYATCLGCAKRYELSWVKHKFAASGGQAVCGRRARRSRAPPGQRRLTRQAPFMTFMTFETFVTFVVKPFMTFVVELHH